MSAGKCSAFYPPASPERSPRTACDPETKLPTVESGGGSGDITQNASLRDCHRVQQNISLVHLYLQGLGHFFILILLRNISFFWVGSEWRGTGGDINGGSLKGRAVPDPVEASDTHMRMRLCSFHAHTHTTYGHIMKIHGRTTWRFRGVYCTLWDIFFSSPSFPSPFFPQRCFQREHERCMRKRKVTAENKKIKAFLSQHERERMVILFSLLFLFLSLWPFVGKERWRAVKRDPSAWQFIEKHVTFKLALFLKRSHKRTPHSLCHWKLQRSWIPCLCELEKMLAHITGRRYLHTALHGHAFDLDSQSPNWSPSKNMLSASTAVSWNTLFYFTLY